MKVSVLISAALILGCPPFPAQAAAMTIPATTRQVVLAKGDGGATYGVWCGHPYLPSVIIRYLCMSVPSGCSAEIWSYSIS